MFCKCCGEKLNELEEKYTRKVYYQYMGEIIDKTVVEEGPLCDMCETLLVTFCYGSTVDGNCDPNWKKFCEET
jgi:hypothetical protein